MTCFLAGLQDDRPECSGQSPSVSGRRLLRGPFLFRSNWASNDCKWVFNEPMLWCHAWDHFEMQMSHLSTIFRRTIKTQLGPRRTA